ncbi:MAG: aminotransferase class V-fold PLP-dependent enzyme [Anaerovoracaceae bacterium]|nr:aminotransferase class V-fold PLP-dependent enzyme [Anaerovoracaceae bacterium]
MDTSKFENVRNEQFPAALRCAYLDTATTGIIPKVSRDAAVAYLDSRCEYGMDIEGYLAQWDHADAMRPLAAEVINADADEIFFGDTGSGMVNVFSEGIPLGENANVVTSGLSFPSTVYTWFNRVGEDHVRIVEPENGAVTCERLFEQVDENTEVISLCLVENTSGWRHDLGRISSFCRERGIYLVIDATQCAGAMRIDVKETPVDFMFITTYKWSLGLFGISYAYVSRDVLDDIRPVAVGWTGNKDKHNHSRYLLDFLDGARRFELGGLNWAGLTELEQSMKLYLSLGKEDVENYILGLTEYLYEKVDGLRDIEVVGPFPEKNRSGIVFLRLPEGSGIDEKALRRKGVSVHTPYETQMRVSMHYYNNRADIDRLTDALREYEK